MKYTFFYVIFFCMIAEEVEEKKTKVVILGAGFGGLSTAIQLARSKKRRKGRVDFEITLIEQNDFHLFTPDLYEIASASHHIQDEEILKKVLSVNLQEAIAGHNIIFQQAIVEFVDPKKQIVHTSTGVYIYDQLVVALGSESFYFGIKGMKEHSVSLKSLSDALHIRRLWFEKLAKNKNAHIIICGAGPAGVEFAAELRKACTDVLQGVCPRITIVEGQGAVLPMFQKKVQIKAARRLIRLGVQMQMNFFIERAEKGIIFSKDGQRLEGDLIVWTGGVKAVSVLEKMHMKLTKRGQLPVYASTQSKEFENIFVLGDSAEVPIGEDTYSSMTAREAVQQANIVSTNIIRQQRGKSFIEYKVQEDGYVITMGGKKGIVVLPLGWVLYGYIGWLLRLFISFRHFKSVLPLKQAWLIWYHGLKIMIKNDTP